MTEDAHSVRSSGDGRRQPCQSRRREDEIYRGTSSSRAITTRTTSGTATSLSVVLATFHHEVRSARRHRHRQQRSVHQEAHPGGLHRRRECCHGPREPKTKPSERPIKSGLDRLNGPEEYWEQSSTLAISLRIQIETPSRLDLTNACGWCTASARTSGGDPRWFPRLRGCECSVSFRARWS